MTDFNEDQKKVYPSPSFSDEELGLIYQIERQAGHVNRATKTKVAMMNALRGRSKSFFDTILQQDFPDLTDKQADQLCGKAVDHAVEALKQKRNKIIADTKGLSNRDATKVAVANEEAIMQALKGQDIPEAEAIKKVNDEGKITYEWPSEFTELDRMNLIAHISRYINGSWVTEAVLEDDKKVLAKLVKKLKWWQAMVEKYPNNKGNGIAGLDNAQAGRIIGAIRNPSNYPTMDCIFKRMGMGCFNGQRQGYHDGRRITGDEAILHGYSTTRRTLMYLSGEANIKKGNVWRGFYDRFKAEIRQKHPEAIDTGRRTKDGEVWLQYTDLHVSNLARRKMEKEILKAMVATWWETYGRCANPHADQGPSDLSQAA